jgi:hypothetical protein
VCCVCSASVVLCAASVLPAAMTRAAAAAMSMARTLLLLLLTTGRARAESIPQAIADKFGAKCLNGSPPPFELALNASSTKWVVSADSADPSSRAVLCLPVTALLTPRITCLPQLFLEGGGWW